MIQLLEAVEWMHSKNVVHCDLKTDNILITTSNNLVVADFGAALVLENVSLSYLCLTPVNVAPVMNPQAIVFLFLMNLS